MEDSAILEKNTNKVIKHLKRAAVMLCLALLIALSIPNTAYAADEALQYNTLAESQGVIPVNGYIGKGAIIIDPEDPEDPPVDIYVEVPVRMVFAAFESDVGKVTSPTYTITNLSEKVDVKVEVEGFEQSNSETTTLNKQLALKLLRKDNVVLVENLFPAEYAMPKLITDRLPKMLDGSENHKLEVNIGGWWSGSFVQEMKPSFNMTLRFTAV